MTPNQPPSLEPVKQPTYMEQIQDIHVTWDVYQTFDHTETPYTFFTDFDTSDYETLQDFKDKLIDATKIQFRNENVKRIVVILKTDQDSIIDGLNFYREDWGVDVYTMFSEQDVEEPHPIKTFTEFAHKC